MNFPTKLLLVTFWLVLAAIVWLLWEQNKQCEEGGGVYVRTMFGAECLKVSAS